MDELRSKEDEDNAEDSDELFSDTETKESPGGTPQASGLVDSPLNLSDTSLLHGWQATPGTAVVPSTPLSLVPFLNRINEQWTSDLETPQADRSERRPEGSFHESAEKSGSSKRTPTVSRFKAAETECASTSPVIISKKVRQRPKRRIFKSSPATDSASVSSKDQTSRNEDSEPRNELNMEPAKDDCKKTLESVDRVDRTSGVCNETGIDTQNFFNDASFSIVDRICSDTFGTGDLVQKEVEKEETPGRTLESKGSERTVNSMTDRKIQSIDSENVERCVQNVSVTQSTADNFSSDTKILTETMEMGSLGFSTASGRKIEVSAAAMSKAQLLFPLNDEDELFDDGSAHVDQNSLDLHDRNSTNEGNRKLVGSNEKNVPEINLSKAEEDLFNELDDEMLEFDGKTGKTNSASFGFSTAGGRSLSVSKKALEKAEKLFADQFEDSESEKSQEKLGEGNTEGRKSLDDFSFATASGKVVKVSEKSMQKARTLFADQFEDSESEKSQEKLEEGNTEGRRSLDDFSFATASGKVVKVSEKSMQKARTLFADQFEDSESEKSQQKLGEGNTEGRKSLDDFSFATASGKVVKVSEKSVQKARTLFADQFEDSESEKSQEKLGEGNTEGRKSLDDFSFATASGKVVKVSEKSMQKARTLFADQFEGPEAPEKLENKEIEVEEGLESFGFATASGRAVKVSEKSMQKARTLFADQFEGPEAPEKLENKEIEAEEGLESFGFATASGRAVKVSEKSMQKARTLFADQFEGPEAPEKSENREIEVEEGLESFGFATASGRAVKVSEKSMQKAQALFAEDLKSNTVDSENVDTVSLQKNSASSKDNFVAPLPIRKVSRKVSKVNEGISKVCEEFCGKNGPSSTRIIKEERVELNLKGVEDDRDDKNSELLENSKMGRSFGFATARGGSIEISKEALSKAESLFASDLEIRSLGDEVEPPGSVNVEIDELQTETSETGLQTTSRRVDVAKKVPPRAQNLENEEKLTFDSSEVQRPRKSIENVHSSRQSVSFKKLKFNEDFLGGKLNSETVASSESKGRETLVKKEESNEFHEGTRKNLEEKGESNDLDCRNSIVKAEKSVEVRSSTKSVENLGKNGSSEEKNENGEYSLLSSEIAASTVALLADECNSVSSIDWRTSPEKKIEKEGVTNVPCSPVIGRRPVSRKKKSLSRRRRHISRLRNEEVLDERLEKEKESGDSKVQENVGLVVGNVGGENFEEMEGGKVERASKSDSNDYGDTQLMMDFIDQSAGILERRLESALQQTELINLKKGMRTKPIAGKLFSCKKENLKDRMSWRKISKGVPPRLCTYQELRDHRLPPEILEITASTASTYRFRCADFYGPEVQSNVEGIKLSDGGSLILDENGYAGLHEICRSFLASPGVDPNLVARGWMENHYGWIVWKLASVDRVKFGSVKLPRTLNPDMVMSQLKYRYDREIDRSQRSAVRKILEKDDVPSKRMVLCVSSVLEQEESTKVNSSPKMLNLVSKKLVLTDGWYSVTTLVDQAMVKHILSGKVREGTKILTYGAELLNCEQGCSPLEKPQGVCLKIHTNSTRRAKWDTKLGYVAPLGPFRVKLKSISPSGGLIGKIVVLVVRTYPMLYHEKTSSGESIFRNARCEEKASSAYERDCRAKVEAFYARAEKSFFSGRKSRASDSDSIDLAAVEWNEDCERLSKEEFLSKKEQERLTSQCRAREEEFRRKLESKLQENLPPPRQVTPLLKVRVVEDETTAILSVWSPSEEVTDILKEGSCIAVCNVTTSSKRGGELQLTAGKKALFSSRSLNNIAYPRRICTPIEDIVKPAFSPDYGEFDTVGVVVSIGNGPYGMKNFESVYLACPKADSSASYLSMLFWHGVSAHGYSEILTVGSPVACANLEWRRATSWSIPVAYSTERTVFTRNPRQEHLRKAFEHLGTLLQDLQAFCTKCNEEILEEVQKKPNSRVQDKSNLEELSLERQLVNCDSPEASGSLLNSVSPTVRSAAIQRRLDKLQCYGEPSRLSPIVINNSSNRVNLEFKSPVRSNAKRIRLDNRFPRESG